MKLLSRLLSFITILICVIFFILPISAIDSNVSDIDFKLLTNLTHTQTTDMRELYSLIQDMENHQDQAHNIAEAGRAIGYDESHLIIRLAKQEWWNAETLKKQYQKNIETNLKNINEDTYPDAAYIWHFLHSIGCNDYAAAGILGNIMAEVGGQTLNIYYIAESSGYYGMCQWSKQYYPDVIGCNLEEQCLFLASNLELAIDTYGFCYKTNFTYEDFLNIGNEQDAALAFAKIYERCTNASYYNRQVNATTAYNYFTN